MKVDKEKLAKLIESEIKDLLNGFHCSSTSVIGDIEGVQIQLVVTDDEDDFIEAPNPDDCCVTD